jgi:hypothetical protein
MTPARGNAGLSNDGFQNFDVSALSLRTFVTWRRLALSGFEDEALRHVNQFARHPPLSAPRVPFSRGRSPTWLNRDGVVARDTEETSNRFDVAGLAVEIAHGRECNALLRRFIIRRANTGRIALIYERGPLPSGPASSLRTTGLMLSHSPVSSIRTACTGG